MSEKSGKKTATMAMAAVVFCVALYCTFARLPGAVSNRESLYMAAGLAMPVSSTLTDDDGSESEVADTPQVERATKPESTGKSTKKAAKIKQYGGEAYPVIENQYGSAGEITIKNTTDFDIDVDYELSQPLGFEIKKTDEPQVLIVHTHTTEAYLQEDNGVYYSEYTGRSTDDSENITSAGRAMAESLTRNGIKALHSATHHDDPSYNGSYDRSADTIYSFLEKYPSIKVVIDFHRDSLGYGGEDGKIKPTFEVNGEKAAQIMVMSGYDPEGAYDFAHWEENLRLALRIQQKAEQLYPGMTRPLYFGDFAYNMNINSGSLLIEVGTEMNTLDEACRTGELLGNVLAKVLREEWRVKSGE